MKINASSQLGYLIQNLPLLAEQCQPLWHPLGFVSCAVRDEPKKLLVRVHYWPKDERRTKSPDWPIHTHIYDLSSLVLSGRVRDLQYEATEGTDYTVYSVSYVGADSAISPSSRALSVMPFIDREHSHGEEYSVPVGVFHQTLVPLEECALTLVALSNFQDTEPLVLGQAGSNSYPYDRVPFDKVQFWTEVRKAITTCGLLL